MSSTPEGAVPEETWKWLPIAPAPVRLRRGRESTRKRSSGLREGSSVVQNYRGGWEHHFVLTYRGLS